MALNPCPGGYFCGIGTKNIANYHLCKPGQYCTEATTKTASTNNPCLAGYFCPAGTSAVIGDTGVFDNVTLVDFSEWKLEKEALLASSSLWTTEDSADLENASNRGSCEENSNLPPELIAGYNSLKCPAGSTSNSGSQCIGECELLSSREEVAKLDPIDCSSLDQATLGFLD